jgi:hypothetical protein
MRYIRIALGILAAVLLVAGLSAASQPQETPLAAAATATGAPAGMPTPPEKSWILVDLPPDATQLEYGGEIWRLVCSACHAYDGTGLTDAWRATWPPEDQNCWKSKCHGPNHPPDGFVLPVAPGVVGNAALAAFPSAQELHDYIQAAMPWQRAGTLTSKDSWAVTAYVIKLNRMNPGAELGPDNASQIKLGKPRAEGPQSAGGPAPAGVSMDAYLPVAGGILVLLVIGFALVRRFGTRRRPPG